MSAIHYKFKSDVKFHTVKFDGVGMTVAELKREIVTKHSMQKAENIDLKITNAETQEVYEDDATIIPKNTQVIINRIPSSKPNVLNSYLSASIPTAEAHNAGFVGSNALRGIQARPTQMRPRGTVPLTYICKRCGEKGHFIGDCPKNNDPAYDKRVVRTATGIPKAFLQRIDNPESYTGNEQIVVGEDGVTFYAVKPQVQVFDQYIKDTRVLEQKVDIESLAPDHLKCPLCKLLVKDAVRIACCSTTFCDSCIRKELLEKPECPKCHQTGMTPDSLISNESMRTQIKEFIATAGVEAKQDESAAATPVPTTATPATDSVAASPTADNVLPATSLNGSPSGTPQIQTPPPVAATHIKSENAEISDVKESAETAPSSSSTEQDAKKPLLRPPTHPVAANFNGGPVFPGGDENMHLHLQQQQQIQQMVAQQQMLMLMNMGMVNPVMLQQHLIMAAAQAQAHAQAAHQNNFNQAAGRGRGGHSGSNLGRSYPSGSRRRSRSPRSRSRSRSPPSRRDRDHERERERERRRYSDDEGDRASKRSRTDRQQDSKPVEIKLEPATTSTSSPPVVTPTVAEPSDVKASTLLTTETSVATGTDTRPRSRDRGSSKDRERSRSSRYDDREGSHRGGSEKPSSSRDASSRDQERDRRDRARDYSSSKSDSHRDRDRDRDYRKPGASSSERDREKEKEREREKEKQRLKAKEQERSKEREREREKEKERERRDKSGSSSHDHHRSSERESKSKQPPTELKCAA